LSNKNFAVEGVVAESIRIPLDGEEVELLKVMVE